jgi:hypothetical protein
MIGNILRGNENGFAPPGSLLKGLTEPAILEEGGRKEEKNGRTVLIVPCSFEGGK